MGDFDVTVSAGSLRTDSATTVAMPHSWTPEGVTIEAAFTGAHLLHLAVAGCVLNDLYREAANLGVELAGVRVTASGDFDRESWQSTGIEYSVELDTTADTDAQGRLLQRVDDVAEIPKAVRSGASVMRAGGE